MKPRDLYNKLKDEYGSLQWWPVDKTYHEENGTDPRFEIITGAILTQNTSWSNVEKALKNLKEEKKLDSKNMIDVETEKLHQMIHPSGFYKQKTKRLKKIAIHIQNGYNHDLQKLFNQPTQKLRDELLSLKGIGPETADSILLYAGEKPVFVVDNYTKRLCQRIPIETKCSYQEIQKYFEEDIEKNYSTKKLPEVYKEFHALIVEHAKNYCKTKPQCKQCFLREECQMFK
ncbi:MAG: endonuclease [Candidatus Thermoplasmatota archaeon]